MSLPAFATQTVTVKRPATVTDHGTAVYDYTDTTDHNETGVSVQPRAGNIDLISRYAVTTLYVVFAELTADVLDSDHVLHAGNEYAMDTPVQRFETGVLDHVEFGLKKVAG